ncbi:MAG: hypothetical protein NC483_02450 [Ruminococcus sp.]|nr:hypothetical protein [Ruminococcus sp.]
MKKKTKILIIGIIVFVVILFTLLIRLIFIEQGYIIENNLKYVRDYISGEDNIKGDVNIGYFAAINDNYEIGANKYGYAVFKDPKRAFKSLKKDYVKGINLIKEEFNLSSLNNFNYSTYKTLGWQVTTGTEEEKREARFITLFMDIYENSFKGSY